MTNRRRLASGVLASIFFALAFAAAPALTAKTYPAAAWQSPASAKTIILQQNSSGAPDSRAHESEKRVTSYTLPPETYAKARHLSRISFLVRFFLPFYQIGLLALMLRWGWSSKFRDWAEAASSRRIVQAAIYSSLFLLAFTLPQLPIAAWVHWLLRRYNLVVQGWGSWLWDHVKTQIVTTIIGIIAIAGLFRAIRTSPRRWWLYFWLGSIPITVFFIFISPYVIDPLFNTFEPLQSHDPALVDSLERVVARAGLTIPPERMFWMKASEKVKFVNAYVTGIGASKRVVVWDTTIEKMTNAQILFVFGHEMGHYVLGHIPKQIALLAALFFLLIYIGFRLSNRVLQQWSQAWRIRAPDDWASLPVYAGCLLLLLFVATPITNGVSRYFEHQADQYGLEVTHGITPDSGQIAAQSFQILGEIDFEDPAPNRLEIWWFWDHPWIGDRIKFSLEYDPWSKGESPEFVK
ncbi:MAG: M48 family metallopeptidase [Candidatus Acidiferrales bacterium]